MNRGALSGAKGGDVRDAWVLVRTEILVRLRHYRNDRRKLAAAGSTVVLFGAFIPFWLWGTIVGFGRDLASGSVPLGSAGAVFATLAVAAGYIGAAGGFKQERGGSVGPLIRTSIPSRAVSLGRLVSETARNVAFAVPLLVAVLVGVWIGAGDPVVPVVVVLAALPVALWGLLVGRLLGDGLRVLNARVGVSLWTKALVTVVVTMLVFVGTQAFLFDEFGGTDYGGTSVSLPAVLPGTPMQSYAGVVLGPLGASGRPLGWLVVAVLVLSIPGAFALALRVEGHLLEADDSESKDAVSGTRGVPRPFTFGPAWRVAWRYLLRTRRDPRTLAHLMPLLFGALASGANLLGNPDAAFTFGPSAAVVGGAILAGAAYCLNPLGDDRDQLPLLLTSTGSTGVLLRGRALAGIVPGLLLAIGIGVPLALVEHSVLYVVWQSVLAVVLAASGTGVALGIGALVPAFERREYMSVERPHPSNYALFGFALGGLATGGIGLVLVELAAGDTSPQILGIAWTAYLLVVGLSGLAGYVYAVRTFDDLSLDAI